MNVKTRSPTDSARKLALEARSKKADGRVDKLRKELEAANQSNDKKYTHKSLAALAGVPLSTYWRFLKKDKDLEILADSAVGQVKSLDTSLLDIDSDDIKKLRKQLDSYSYQLIAVMIELEESKLNLAAVKGELESYKLHLAATKKNSDEYLLNLNKALNICIEKDICVPDELKKYIKHTNVLPFK